MIEDTIGTGGMGAVYRAVDQKFGSLVAIKETLYGDAPHLTEAFEREARLLNGLHHPIFPHVSDCFTENGGHFLVMEYIEGEDLSETLKRAEIFPVETVVGWACDLLDGLDYLHSQDPPIIHRDIKPNNLKLTSRGKIVLLDFGMAKERSSNTLAARSVFGYSRRYSPLEQIEGSGTDTTSDIFSLGATLYHLLTGQPPVDALARASAIVARKPDPLVRADILNPHVPEGIASALQTALALNAENRFWSAREMAHPFAMLVSSPPFASLNVADPIPVQHTGQITTNAVEPSHVDLPEQSVANGPVVVFTEDDLNPAEQLAKGSPSFSAGGEFRRRIRGALPTSVSSFQIRRPPRRSYAVFAVLCLLAFALMFATYRGLQSDEATLPQQAVATESSASAIDDPATPDAAVMDQEVAASENDTADAESIALANEEAARSRSSVATDPIDLRKGPINNRAKRPAEVAKENVSTEPLRPTRSTRVRPQDTTAARQRSRRTADPVFRQPSVSSIESIMTGASSDQRRIWAEEDYLRLQEERRLRRLRRIREARRNGYPF